MMVSRKVLDEVGIFDPDFFMYSESTELSWRIKKWIYNKERASIENCSFGGTKF